jgi:hypothetical protein
MMDKRRFELPGVLVATITFSAERQTGSGWDQALWCNMRLSFGVIGVLLTIDAHHYYGYRSGLTRWRLSRGEKASLKGERFRNQSLSRLFGDSLIGFASYSFGFDMFESEWFVFISLSLKVSTCNVLLCFGELRYDSERRLSVRFAHRRIAPYYLLKPNILLLFDEAHAKRSEITMDNK